MGFGVFGMKECDPVWLLTFFIYFNTTYCTICMKVPGRQTASGASKGWKGALYRPDIYCFCRCIVGSVAQLSPATRGPVWTAVTEKQPIGLKPLLHRRCGFEALLPFFLHFQLNHIFFFKLNLHKKDIFLSDSFTVNGYDKHNVSETRFRTFVRITILEVLLF